MKLVELSIIVKEKPQSKTVLYLLLLQHRIVEVSFTMLRIIL